MTLTPEKADRIAGMFVRGYSLDLISEWGLHNGWKRDDAKAVVESKGWSLDWSGRLQDRYRPAEQISSMTPPRHVGDADIERMITVGLEHELVEIRRYAVKAQNATADLRSALIRQEERDAEEVARRRQAKIEADAERLDPSRWRHGTWGGYLQHKYAGVEMCEPCEKAGDAYKDEASASGRTVNKGLHRRAS